MCGTCKKDQRDEKCLHDFSREIWKEKTVFQYLGVDGRILEWILGKEGGKVSIIFVWLWVGTCGGAPVNTVTSLCVP
jgi:hypothetical protein